MAANTSKSSDARAAKTRLPLPEAVLRHHAANLEPILEQWLAQKRVPPVLLVTGPAGVGKRSLMHYVSQWLLCERTGFSKGPDAAPAEDEGPGLFGDLAPAPAPEVAPTGAPGAGRSRPCGECAACQRALKGNWVDFSEILPEDEDSDTLKIEQFRRMKASLGFGAHEGGYRIHLICGADRMTIAAANSLLKILEEPPPNWVFFLTASDPSLLLPTIVSRCQRLRLKPFTTEALREVLASSEVPATRHAVCAELAQGSWGKALALAEDEVWEKRSQFFLFLEHPARELAALVDWAAQDPRNFSLMIDQLEHLASDLVHWSMAVEPGGSRAVEPGGSRAEDPASYMWRNSDGKRALLAHATALARKLGGAARAREFWLERCERLARARQESLAPLNRKILAQDLLLPWLEIQP